MLLQWYRPTADTATRAEKSKTTRNWIAAKEEQVTCTNITKLSGRPR